MSVSTVQMALKLFIATLLITNCCCYTVYEENLDSDDIIIEGTGVLLQESFHLDEETTTVYSLSSEFSNSEHKLHSASKVVN